VGLEQIMKKLKNGWVEGSVKKFLNPPEADAEYIELRLNFTGASKGYKGRKRRKFGS
jgi:hypothetical protein